MSQPIRYERRGRAGLVTLARADALNALTLEMCVSFRERLAQWAQDPAVGWVVVRGEGRAFSAGGDIRRLYHEGLAGSDYPVRFFTTEYRLNAAIRRFPKPYVALIDGVVMGGGVGISVHGSHRVMSERARFSMPETGIGMIPDVGTTYVLSRLGGGLGRYIALSGARLDQADAIAAGLADAHVAGADFDALWADLAHSPPDQAIASHARDPGPAAIDAHRGAIGRVFGAGRLSEILSHLREEGEWGETVGAMLATKSPTSLAICARQLARGRRLGFEACLKLEYRIVRRIFAGHDFYEGTRALIIDKDNAPRWRPARIDDVRARDVTPYFAPLGADELNLD